MPRTNKAKEPPLELQLVQPATSGNTILEHLNAFMSETNSNGFTYASALAFKWLEMALDGNMAALKEILVRLAPVEEPGHKTIRYILGPNPDRSEPEPA